MDNALELLDLKVYNYTYTVPIVTNDTHLDKVDLSPFKLYPLDEAKNTTKPVKPAKPAKPAKKPVKVIIRNKKKHGVHFFNLSFYVFFLIFFSYPRI